MADNILEVKNLKVSFRTNNGTVKAVRDISFNLERGKTLAIVGESGSGKSVTSKVILGISAPNAIIEGGEVLYDGKDITKIGEDQMYEIRGDKIAMIFQDPLSSLDPIVRIGKQITEAMLLKNKARRKRSRKEFNERLGILKDNCIEAFKDDSQVTNKHIEEMIETFDHINIKALELEYSYNDDVSKAHDIVSDIEEFIFLGNKNRKVNCRSSVKSFAKEIGKLDDIFFTKGYVEKLQNETNTLKELASKQPSKASKPDETLLSRLQETIDLLKKIENEEKPRFLRAGYYAYVKNLNDLLTISTKEANEISLKLIEEDYMVEFKKVAAKGLINSNAKATEGRKKILPMLEAISNYCNSEQFSVDDLKPLVNDAKKNINDAIDFLELKKDTVALTYIATIEGFMKKYKAAIKENIREDRRVARQTAKRERVLARGKKIDWKIVPKKATDPKDVINDIKSATDRLKSNFASAIENNKNLDFAEISVQMIDQFREKASAVVYKLSKREAKEKALKLMEEVGIPEPRLRFKQYPFEFSGGMRQRIVIAIALAANPEILICDEPTTALDVTIQSQILELINELKRERNLSIIFITHDLGVVANMADSIAVMYAGKIVEYGTSEDIFYRPAHPYTWALLSSMPDLDTKEVLEAIPGTPPNMIYPPVGDAFAARNKYALKIDFEKQPPMFKITDTHYAATWLLDPKAPKIEMPKIISDRIARMRKKGASN